MLFCAQVCLGLLRANTRPARGGGSCPGPAAIIAHHADRAKPGAGSNCPDARCVIHLDPSSW
jgi:hypothetical protein